MGQFSTGEGEDAETRRVELGAGGAQPPPASRRKAAGLSSDAGPHLDSVLRPPREAALLQQATGCLSLGFGL